MRAKVLPMKTRTTLKTTTPDLRDPGSNILPASSGWTICDRLAVAGPVLAQVLDWLDHKTSTAFFIPVTTRGRVHPWVCHNAVVGLDGITLLRTLEAVDIVTMNGRETVATRTVQ